METGNSQRLEQDRQASSAFSLGTSTKSSSKEWAERERRILADDIAARYSNADKSLFEIPKRFSKCFTLGALDWVLERNRAAVDACVAFSKNPSTVPAPFLMGPSGCGKTHLFWATASDLQNHQHSRLDSWAEAALAAGEKQIESGKRPTTEPPNRLLIEATNGADIAHELRSSVKNDSVDRAVNSFRQVERHDEPPRFGATTSPGSICKVLLIDDIEIMKMGDWLAEELYRIVDYRYAENMPTMYVSNLAPEELRNHLGDRIARRMLDMTKPVVMR